MEEQLTYMDELFTLPAYADDEEQQRIYLKALQEELIFHYEHNDMYPDLNEKIHVYKQKHKK